MSDKNYFSKERVVYWPGEFADVVNYLTGKNADGVSLGNPLYQFNTDSVIKRRRIDYIPPSSLVIQQIFL